MKEMKTLGILAVLGLSLSSQAEAKSGGAYDFEQGLNVKILKEAIVSATNGEQCKVLKLVRAVGAAMFESPGLPTEMANSDTLSKEELACFQTALKHVQSYRESLDKVFTETKE
jgi:hypothetical protein